MKTRNYSIHAFVCFLLDDMWLFTFGWWIVSHAKLTPTKTGLVSDRKVSSKCKDINKRHMSSLAGQERVGGGTETCGRGHGNVWAGARWPEQEDVYCARYSSVSWNHDRICICSSPNSSIQLRTKKNYANKIYNLNTLKENNTHTALSEAKDEELPSDGWAGEQST